MSRHIHDALSRLFVIHSGRPERLLPGKGGRFGAPSAYMLAVMRIEQREHCLQHEGGLLPDALVVIEELVGLGHVDLVEAALF